MPLLPSPFRDSLAVFALAELLFWGYPVDAQTLTVFTTITTDPTDCDGLGIFSCQGGGTCYAGSDGFIGCCSVSSCAARTTCIPGSRLSTTSCDQNTGGCVVCTNSNLPLCNTVYNDAVDGYIMYCDSTQGIYHTSYQPLLYPTSTATPAATPTALTTTTLASTYSSSVTTSDSTTTSTITPSPAANPAGHGSTSSISAAAIAGIALGSAGGTAIILFLTGICYRKRKRATGKSVFGARFGHHKDTSPRYSALTTDAADEHFPTPRADETTDNHTYHPSPGVISEVEGSPPSTLYNTPPSSYWQRISRTSPLSVVESSPNSQSEAIDLATNPNMTRSSSVNRPPYQPAFMKNSPTPNRHSLSPNSPEIAAELPANSPCQPINSSNFRNSQISNIDRTSFNGEYLSAENAISHGYIEHDRGLLVELPADDGSS